MGTIKEICLKCKNWTYRSIQSFWSFSVHCKIVNCGEYAHSIFSKMSMKIKQNRIKKQLIMRNTIHQAYDRLELASVIYGKKVFNSLYLRSISAHCACARCASLDIPYNADASRIAVGSFVCWFFSLYYSVSAYLLFVIWKSNGERTYLFVSVCVERVTRKSKHER